MEKGFWAVIWITLSMPLWLLFYEQLVPDVVNHTETITIEPDLDCAYCIEVCHGGTYEKEMAVINTVQDITPTMSDIERMKTEHPVLFNNMAKYFDSVVQIKEATLFSDAFRVARAELGPGNTFTWNHREYNTYYKEELEVTNQSID